MDGIERIFGYFGKNLKGSEREKVNFFAQKETKIFLTYLSI